MSGRTNFHSHSLGRYASDLEQLSKHRPKKAVRTESLCHSKGKMGAYPKPLLSFVLDLEAT